MKTDNISLGSITKPLGAFLDRFHLVSFIVVALGGLAVATLLFYGQIMASQDITNAESIETTMPNFDTATIRRLDDLNESSETTELSFPPGQRLNPFTE